MSKKELSLWDKLKAKSALRNVGVKYHILENKVYISIEGTLLEELLPKKFIKEYPLGIPIRLDDYTYPNLIADLVKNNYENVEEVVNKVCKTIAVQYEKDKIKQRKRKLEIKNVAERELFGKIKTKRKNLTGDEKESIFDKFNHECAVCGAEEGLHIHHKNRNPQDNRVENLVVLCGICHKKTHMRVR